MGGIVNDSRLGCLLRSQKRQAGQRENIHTPKKTKPVRFREPVRNSKSP